MYWNVSRGMFSESGSIESLYVQYVSLAVLLCMCASVERKSHFHLSEENITASLSFFFPTNHLVILIYLKCVSPGMCLCERENGRLLSDGFMRRMEGVQTTSTGDELMALSYGSISFLTVFLAVRVIVEDAH